MMDRRLMLVAAVLVTVMMLSSAAAGLEGGDQNKTYTDINSNYDTDTPITTLLGLLLLITGVMIMLVGVFVPGSAYSGPGVFGKPYG